MAPPSRQPVSLARQLILSCFFIALGVPLVGQSFVNTQVVKEQQSVVRWMGVETAERVAARANAWYSAWALETGLYKKAMSLGAASGKLADKAGESIFSPPTSSTDKQDCVAKQAQYAVRDSAGRFSNDPCDTEQLKIKDSDGRFIDGSLPAPSAAPKANGVAAAFAPGGRPGAHDMKFESILTRWVLGAFGVLYFAGYRASLLIVWLPLLIPLMGAIVLEGEVRRKVKQHSYGGISALQYRGGVRLSSWGMGFAIAIFFAPGALPPAAVPAMFVLVTVGIAMWTANMMKNA